MTGPDDPISGEWGPSVPSTSRDSELTSFAGQLYVSKLSTKQVIVWSVLAVVLIALDMGMSAIEARAITPFLHGAVTVVMSWPQRIIWWFSVVSFSACLVTSGILIRSGCFRMLGRLQPGHWIVLILATGGIMGRIAKPFGLLSIAYHSPPGRAGHISEAVVWFCVLAIGGLFMFAAIRLRDAKRWKVLLVCSSANVFYWGTPLMLSSSNAMSGSFFQLYLWSRPNWFAILVVIALVTVFIDWPRRATRDWSHWLGVSLWTLGNLAACVDATTMAWLRAGH